MPKSEAYRRMYRDVLLDVEDLLLLESFQIGYLPGWVPERELAAVLHAHPHIAAYLRKRQPGIESFMDRVLAGYPPVRSDTALALCADKVVWTIADLLIYNKWPGAGAYDAREFHRWNFREITDIVALDGKVVIDSGAGTGRVALEAALTARHVFAVEPVATLRQYLRAKVSDAGLKNVFVVDGFNDAIPLPDSFADVVLTSHALGWRLEAELCEFQRVVKPGGCVMHCPGTAAIPREELQHRRLVADGYATAVYDEADGAKRKYWKRIVEKPELGR